ncbi:hypothetical protein QW131_12610 [Roseibium salinum]|nr:hypothetical protein [Roseibium salinum]
MRQAEALREQVGKVRPVLGNGFFHQRALQPEVRRDPGDAPRFRLAFAPA